MSGSFLRSPSRPDETDARDETLPGLVVGGIVPFTTLDFPDRLTAVLFLQGCPWRCAYCFNRELQPFGAPAMISREEILDFLKKRRLLLDAVVFSGGEPTLQEGLPAWMRYVREAGFEAGLHTSGMCPAGLKKALSHCDWVGMDIKTSPDAYRKVTGARVGPEIILKSAALIINSGVDYEFRMTVHPELMTEAEIFEGACAIRDQGASRFVIQKFRPHPCIDSGLCRRPVPGAVIGPALERKLRAMFASFEVRE